MSQNIDGWGATGVVKNPNFGWKFINHCFLWHIQPMFQVVKSPFFSPELVGKFTFRVPNLWDGWVLKFGRSQIKPFLKPSLTLYHAQSNDSHDHRSTRVKLNLQGLEDAQACHVGQHVQLHVGHFFPLLLLSATMPTTMLAILSSSMSATLPTSILLYF